MLLIGALLSALALYRADSSVALRSRASWPTYDVGYGDVLVVREEIGVY
jgi:hypothetical protein